MTLGAPGSIKVDTSSIPSVVAGQFTLELYDCTSKLLAKYDLRPSLDVLRLCYGTYTLGLNLGRVELERLDGLVVPEGSG